ncbi:MAG: hypothetical protein ACFCVD_11575 [Nodosilinea sp.]
MISGPLVKQIDGAIFQIGGQQGEAFALPLGEVGGRQFPGPQVNFVVELKGGEVGVGLRHLLGAI